MDLEKTDDTIAPRRFELANDQSYKFWTIALEGTVLRLHWGKIGNAGQSKEVAFASAEEAKSNYTKRIREKTKGGYREKKQPVKKVVTNQTAWDSLRDHEPFLKSILEDPDDLVRYAIYADWLIERNDPLGRFTQLQTELQDPALPFYRKGKLEKEADQLRVLHSRKWLGNLARWLMDGGLASYPYQFQLGQLSSIACSVLDLEFACELRQSPHCRLLRELTIIDTQHLDRTIYLDGHRFQSDRKYGLETLLGADFSNLRDFRIGIADHIHMAERGNIGNPGQIIELLRAMPRLETLYLCADVHWADLFQISMPQLRTLHVLLPPGKLSLLADSGLVPQLHTLGFFSRIDDAAAKQLVAMAGFEDLAEFVAIENSDLTEKGKRTLESTGVLISLKMAYEV